MEIWISLYTLSLTYYIDYYACMLFDGKSF